MQHRTNLGPSRTVFALYRAVAVTAKTKFPVMTKIADYITKKG